MGDRLRADKLSQYVTSHPGQLSLVIPLWVGEMSTSLGWEGNRRSGVYAPSEYGPPLPFYNSPIFMRLAHLVRGDYAINSVVTFVAKSLVGH